MVVPGRLDLLMHITKRLLCRYVSTTYVERRYAFGCYCRIIAHSINYDIHDRPPMFIGAKLIDDFTNITEVPK